ncbi:MAG: ATP-binding protein [Nanoarchaeota archaeon]|nr:ATP-binding protein [Nanoarchaeota archaeon]MBU1855014.1 ATP-binding protein [Nanoarchaeota archaeon]
MILGKITGKATTMDFTFKAEKETKNFEYVQVYHEVYDYVLCQIVGLETSSEGTLAKCKIIGYKDEDGKVKQIRIPFDLGAEVLKADDEFIKKIIKLEDESKGSFLGKLEGRDIKIFLDMNKLLTKHCAVLAKSGAGKSYTVGVLAEEILDRKIPLLIIDPHGEYSKMRYENTKEKEKLASFGLKPQAYEVKEYGDSKINKGVIPIKLTKDITNSELIHLLPAKLSGTQMGVLYSALKNLDQLNFNELLLELERDESSAKWSIINVIEYLNNLNIFSDSPTPYSELIRPGNCSIINLKGMPPDIQGIIVYKLCKDLFELRKNNRIPPFFLILEEAHNFCPERSFGEAKSSKILRTIASEGRKFGMGFCVISQRPARVDKSVLSQCTTQITMKVTNPNDLKAIFNSVEGITAESESEIQNLPIGTALVSGLVDIPLFVNIRPRKSMHGGEAVNILEEQEPDVMKELKGFEKQELIPVIKPNTTVKDIKLMSEEGVEVKTKLIPAAIITCKDKEGDFNVLIELIDGTLVIDKEKFETKKLPDINHLTTQEVSILKKVFAKQPIDKSQAQNLIEKEYLTDDLQLSDSYIFSKLRNQETYENVDFMSISYDEKLEPMLGEETIKQRLSEITQVKEYKECYIIKYETS